MFCFLAIMAEAKDLVILSREDGDSSSKLTVHLHGKISLHNSRLLYIALDFLT